jgi:hypothetical protein
VTPGFFSPWCGRRQSGATRSRASAGRANIRASSAASSRSSGSGHGSPAAVARCKYAVTVYGLRGWPVLQALYVELSVEPAPPGEWRVHQLDSKHYESEVERAQQKELEANLAMALAGGDTADVEQAMRLAIASAEEKPQDTALAHSFVYNDPRAHRAIERWLAELEDPVPEHQLRAI